MITLKIKKKKSDESFKNPILNNEKLLERLEIITQGIIC